MDVHGSDAASGRLTRATLKGNPVFAYHDAFNPDVDEVADLKDRYVAGRVGDVEVKQRLVAALECLPRPDSTASA